MDGFERNAIVFGDGLMIMNIIKSLQHMILLQAKLFKLINKKVYDSLEQVCYAHF